jgi:protein-tyrosine kinase
VSIVQSALERMKSNRAAEPRASVTPSKSSSRGGTAAEASPPEGIPWPPATAPLVDISTERLREIGLYPSPDFLRRQQADYRSIRREVISATHQRPQGDGAAAIGPIVVITSALPGEGKSYTALNLALSIASEGTHDVLLIDGDTVRSSLSRSLGVSDAPGLIELLATPNANFLEYVRHTVLPRLHVLPAGQTFDGASDLFSAGRVGPLFSTIGSVMTGHVVIVDTPPILLSSDTPVLTDVAGQVLLVVRSGQTLQDSVRDAVSRIRETIPVGAVLNGWDPILPSEKQTYSGYEAYEKK